MLFFFNYSGRFLDFWGCLYCSFILHQSKQRTSVWIEYIGGVCASVSLQINNMSLCILPVIWGTQCRIFGGQFRAEIRESRLLSAEGTRKNGWEIIPWKFILTPAEESDACCSFVPVWAWKDFFHSQIKGGLVFAGFAWGLLVLGLACEWRTRTEEWGLKGDWGGKERIQITLLLCNRFPLLEKEDCWYLFWKWDSSSIVYGWVLQIWGEGGSLQVWPGPNPPCGMFAPPSSVLHFICPGILRESC